MVEITKKIGVNAGKIWIALDTHGPQNQSTLLKNTKLSLKDLHAGVGWLARENKIYKDGSTYKLGETNLTGIIGENAGKIWEHLNSQNNIDISTISKITQIKIQDAYLAMGWLAREDKITAKKINPNKIEYKLK